VDRFNHFQCPVAESSQLSLREESTENVPIFGILDVPRSICVEIRNDAQKYLGQVGWVTSGPTGSCWWLCYNQKKQKSPITVKASNDGKSIVCEEKLCLSFKLYKFCCHTIAVAVKIHCFDQYVKCLNQRQSKVVSKVVMANKDKDAGRKRTKNTQIRKGPANKKAPTVTEYIDPVDKGASHTTQSTMQTIISPSSQPVASHMLDPQPGSYVLTLLGLCHANVSTCYGCNGKFRVPCPPLPPLDLVVVSKTKRIYYDNTSRQFLMSPTFSKVYFHFNQACIASKDSLFSPFSILVPEDLKPFLLYEHVKIIASCGIFAFT